MSFSTPRCKSWLMVESWWARRVQWDSPGRRSTIQRTSLSPRSMFFRSCVMRLPLESSMDQVISGGFVPPRIQLWPRDSFRVVDWNIERGLQFESIVEFLKKSKADLILLQEVDLNAKRTRHMDVAREIAKALQLNFVFGTEFQELTQGSKSSPAFQGQATLSPWPIKSPKLIRFQHQTNFWQPHWYLPRIEPFQERLGGRIALVADVE